MSRVNAIQMEKLLDLLNEEGVLVNGKVAYTNTNKQIFWKRIAAQLNAVEGGVYKNTWKWCKMWADWKNKTKKKANILLRRRNYSLEHPCPTLTTLELRLLKMIDYPVDEKNDTLTLQMVVNKVEFPEGNDEMQTDYFNDEYNDPHINKLTSAEEDNDNTKYFSKFCDVDEMSNGCDKLKLIEESSDIEKKVKMKGKIFKKNKSLHEFKLKTAITLEKEKCHQKSEELRLRALELKLKAEELRLKEMEMNKINYLTNIEEEKLKCFKEISSSLKELLERSRNGNIRFPNII